MTEATKETYGDLAGEFAAYTATLNGLLAQDGTRLEQPADEEQWRRCIAFVKHAIAAVLVNPQDFANYADHPRDLPIVMQWRGGTVRQEQMADGTLECPGGAMISREELDEIEARGIDPLKAPGNLFYQILLRQLLYGGEHGVGTLKPVFTYPDLTPAALEANLRLELRQEMGEDAAAMVKVGALLSDAPQLTDLTSVVLGKDWQGLLVHRYPGLRRKGAGGIEPVITRVSEDVALGQVDDLAELQRAMRTTEEASGGLLTTLGALLKSLAASSGSIAAWRAALKGKGYPRLRAPSTAWQLQQLCEHAHIEVHGAE